MYKILGTTIYSSEQELRNSGIYPGFIFYPYKLHVEKNLGRIHTKFNTTSLGAYMIFSHDMKVKIDMAKRQAADFEWSFVNFRFNAKQRTEFATWYEKTKDDLDTVTGQLLLSGYKITISFDDFNDTATCAITPGKNVKINKDTSLVCKHSDWYKAMIMCLFAHYEVYEGGAWEKTIASEEDWW